MTAQTYTHFIWAHMRDYLMRSVQTISELHESMPPCIVDMYDLQDMYVQTRSELHTCREDRKPVIFAALKLSIRKYIYFIQSLEY